MKPNKKNLLLTNNIITIEVAEHGAEMPSLTKDGREYLWTGDPQFWNRHAPILFPAVGKPFNNEIHVNGVEVELWDRHCNPVLNVNCPQAEAYGIWAPHKKGCPFVCLEPWCGICDSKGFTEDISKRKYIHRLAPGETYTFIYTIEVY